MEENKEELVSVIMSVYNEEEIWLRLSIESILNQTWRNLEFLIVNDNPDNELIKRVLFEYEKKDKRIRLILNEKNIGLAASMNLAAKQAKGKYIARMDADDISVSERLEKEIYYLENYYLDMVASNRINISEKGEVIEFLKRLPDSKKINYLLPYKNLIVHPSILLKRQVFFKMNGYRTFPSAQDYDLWLRMLTSGYKIGILDEPLIYYRLRNDGITGLNHYKQFLLTQYARKLYRERKKHRGKDEFSEENMHKYIAAKYTKSKKEKFEKASRYFTHAIENYKRGQKVKGIGFVLKSMMVDYNYIGEVFRFLLYETIK